MLSVDFAVTRAQGRLHKSLKATRVVTLLYVNFLFVVFGFSLASRLVFILHFSYMLISHVRKELSHSDWLFVCKLKNNP